MPSSRPQIRTAGRDDNQALLDLIFHNPQAGRILLASDRSPDFFARAAPYHTSRVLIGDDGSGIAGTVSCGLKDVCVQGHVQRAAYIFDLAVAERARGQGWARRLLDDAEAWAREARADFLYAHVLAGNQPALKTFGHAGYRQVVRLKALLFPAPTGGARAVRNSHPVGPEDWPAAAQLIARELQDYDLSPAEAAERLPGLWQRLPGYRDELAWIDGRPPSAVLGLWDYSAVSRSVFLRLPPELRALGAVLRALRRLGLPLPPVPAPGETMKYGLLLGAAGEPQALLALLRCALAQAGRIGLDALVYFHDPRRPPAWARARSFSGAFHLVAKTVRPGRASTLGERPIWVDPIDL